MPRTAYGVEDRRMLVGVLGALLFLAAFMFAWSTVGAVQDRRVPPVE
jgi:hypothetical protein